MSEKGQVTIPKRIRLEYALENGARLLARDRGYHRDTFTGLTVIEPEMS